MTQFEKKHKTIHMRISKIKLFTLLLLPIASFAQEEIKVSGTVKSSIDNLIKQIMSTPENAPKISAIVEERLGRDKKLSQATEENLEQIIMIEYDLKALLA